MSTLVEVAVKAEHRDGLRRGGGQRVCEQSLQEDNLLVEKTIAREIRFDRIERYCEVGDAADGKVSVGVRLRRKALEGVRGDNASIGDLVCGEYRAHHDRRAAAPDAGFDEVSGHVFRDHALAFAPDVLHAQCADHGGCL